MTTPSPQDPGPPSSGAGSELADHEQDIGSSAQPQGTPGTARHASPSSGRSFFSGRGALLMAAMLAAFTAYIIYGILTMDVPDSAQSPGPKLYPTLLAVVSSLLVVALVIDALRNPDYDEGDTRYLPPVGEERSDSMIRAAERTDTRNLIIAMVSFLVFALVLEPIGWIISAALLFWVLTLTLGSGRPLFNIAVGLVVSCAIQVAFSFGLGLSLPAGILGGVF